MRSIGLIPPINIAVPRADLMREGIPEADRRIDTDTRKKNAGNLAAPRALATGDPVQGDTTIATEVDLVVTANTIITKNAGESVQLRALQDHLVNHQIIGHTVLNIQQAQRIIEVVHLCHVT